MNIPITLINHVLTNKVVNQFRVYIYLKSVCSGHFKVDGDSVQRACNDLGYLTDKTFYKNLDWLVACKWVTVNSKTNSHRIIALDRLCHKLKIESRTSAVYRFEDVEELRPFMYAASIAAEVRTRNWIIRQPVCKEGRTRTSMPAIDILNKTNTLPNRFMAKVIGLDASTISRYKKAAADAGYIKYYHDYKNTKLPKDAMYALQKDDPDEAEKSIIHNGTIHVQLPDKIRNMDVWIKRRNIRVP